VWQSEFLGLIHAQKRSNKEKKKEKWAMVLCPELRFQFFDGQGNQ